MFAFPSFTTKDLFLYLLHIPHTDWLSGVVARDTYGFILTGPDPIMRDEPRLLFGYGCSTGQKTIT